MNNSQPFSQFNLSEALATAKAHHQAGRLPQAEQIARHILQQQPQQVEALNLLGVIACQNGRFEDGIPLYRQALALKPGFTGARENLCLALWKLGKQRIEEAIATYSQIVTFEPNNLKAYDGLGAILQDQNKLEEALSYYQQALSVQPDEPRALNNIGAILQRQGKSNVAITYHQRALAVKPDYVEAHISLGTALQDQGRFQEAADCFERALKLDPNFPNAHYNRGLLLLTQGDYGQGFAEYEWRFQTGEFPPCPFKQPVWDGADLKGRTLLLHAEQGLGDTIQFIRYAAIAAQRGGRVVLTCHKPLMRLLSSIAGIDQMVPLGYPLPEFHTYAPLLSLPHILGTTLDTVPAQVPYLHPPRESTVRLNTPPGAQLKVGIVWSGGNLYKRNQVRSCPLTYFQPLLEIPNIAYYSLQKGIPQMDLLELGWQESHIQDLSQQLTDMAETAAAIAQLDLVITVDTSVAHLAGALGKPVWTLLSYIPDWRWMLHRPDTPWYPTMRLFRQTQPGDWQGVIEQVVQELKNV
ncbi:tetratricopeptide repeat protein [Leptothermofonsia sichuanensis E412]|uniref:tetratricopeptide repeat protein n=1 Tax=Leptothermofonsia sichuanensis TaxID=2917832 RepID=UPI001CA67997|nr:tetratricopeptide repeat protein [Leptothermofonsia sichuanensis]QZZ18835.1 tetratricopeptide repeat protein [Leptothermofonsia sichuanensis E412]